MSGLTITHGGILTTLQDAGRIGWQHLGLSRSGPMDWHAAAWANRLVNNPATTPLLEITVGGLQLTANVNAWLAITGATLDITVDGQKKLGWSRFLLRKGQTLKLGFARHGQRSYLAVPNGFHAESKLGSVATQSREKLGGLRGDGAALQKGDVLTCQDSAELFSHEALVPAYFVPNYAQDEVVLTVLLGGDAENFSDSTLEQFFTQAWQIANQSNRMGIRLQGDGLVPPKRQWSLGVTPGTIQVPPDGNPILLAADCQSMGGYPILGWLCPLDLYRLSQCQPGQRVRFSQQPLEEIQARVHLFQHFFNLTHC